MAANAMLYPHRWCIG